MNEALTTFGKFSHGSSMSDLLEVKALSMLGLTSLVHLVQYTAEDLEGNKLDSQING